jgi:hypothetical protein
MAKDKSPNISRFPKFAEIQILWIIFSGEMEGYCLYRAELDSIEWIKFSKVLRFNALCIEGDDNDLELSIQFGSSGIVLRYDLEDAGPVSVPMNWFEGPTGLILDHRKRTEFLSVLIKPAKPAVRQKKVAKASC